MTDRSPAPESTRQPTPTEESPETPLAETGRRRGKRVAGVFGELLLTAGLLVLLYAVYTVWGTGLATHQAQDELLRDTIGTWAKDSTPVPRTTARPLPEEVAPDPGEGFAVLRIPRLGEDWEWVVVEGVAARDLARGPGHYPGTALPGQVGNFAVAGHRSGHGEPFAEFHRLRPGDEVIVETEVGVYSYVVDRSQIVGPDALWVVDPVPGRPRATPTQRLITLTTCHPRWGSTQRLVISGHLDHATQPHRGE